MSLHTVCAAVLRAVCLNPAAIVTYAVKDNKNEGKWKEKTIRPNPPLWSAVMQK